MSTRALSRGALVVGILAVVVFVALALLVSTTAGASIDRTALGEVQRLASPAVVAAMGLITLLGSQALFVLLPILLIGLWWRRLRWQAAELLLATLGAQFWDSVLKLIFQRPRPTAIASILPGQAYSFPSGHAMVSIAFYGALAYIGWRLLTGWLRALWLAAMVGLVVLIGLSRLVLDVHYPTDVVASWAAGLLWLEIVLGLVGVVAARRGSLGAARSP